jgi:hypothetical protein
MSFKESLFKRRSAAAKSADANIPELPCATAQLIVEPDEVYRSKAATHLTSHRLADFRRNPLLFHKKELGLVRDEDRPAYQIGRAAHTLILEGREVFEKRYAVGGPVNPKTGEVFGERTKAYAEWADAQGKPVLTTEQSVLVESMAASVRAHKHAAELLADGVAEGVVRAEYGGMACQSRIDWVHPERGIVDLKTCDNLDWLEMDAKSYGYAHQFAFYRSVLALIAGVVAPVFIIAVEKREPFRTGVWVMGQNVLALAQKENETAMSRLAKCRETDSWPTGYENIRTFDYL